MPMSRILRIVFLTILLGLAVSPLSAETAAPTIRLLSPARPASETENSSITISGSSDAAGKVSTVHWVNQFGQRGSGTWTGTATQMTTWSASDIPLRLGMNLITVTVADVSNHSASVHLAVNRRAVPGKPSPQPLKVGAGMWQNRPIVYQVWNGHAIVEGDIILNLASLPSAAGAKETATRDSVKPDGLGISYTSQLWPIVNGVHQVPYIVTTLSGNTCSGSGSNSNLTAALTAFNSQFSGLIQFVPWGSQTNYVNICIASGGNSEGYSNVGMDGNEQTLECASGCTVATWLHEMGHTVGLLHEHQRPDRANFITLNLANADLPSVPGNFTLFLYDYQTVGLYDYASVMHYGPFDFSKAGLPVLESTPKGIPLGNNVGYSAGDIDTIERLYGATPSNVTVTTNPAGLKYIVDGTTYTGTQTFSFALTSTHTLNLPADPQVTNPADGSTYAFGSWNDQGARSHTITITPGSNTPTSPATEPAVTMYEANFIRLQPFAYLSPAAYPSGSGTISVSPTPTAEYGGSFFTDRTLVQLTLATNPGYDFYNWFNLPYPPSDNPHSFYIQSPITSAQAVLEPTSTPVTIIGESFTGATTWNPGVAAYVDGNFTFLPTGYTSVYNNTWTAGSTHTISMVSGGNSLQEQSPVTTNVFYNWNSWSDGGAQTHTITQPSTGSQGVSASFTPFYASYTVPPPLGSANSSCAGGVTTSPAGTAYTQNTAFTFYEDASNVTSTATPNPTFPGMVFTGWTGSLSGSANPQGATIQDQFVPTATFNLTSTPIAISSLSPSSAVANANALDVTINGSGFTSSNTTTYVYWNGSYRPYTFVSSTQLIMHLAAGDLANVGGQDVYVGNFQTVTLPNNNTSTCGVGAETSFTVDLVAPTGGPATVTYGGLDTTTQGTWTGKYGADGQIIANDEVNAPLYATVSLTGNTPYTWASSTTNPIALQTSSGSSTRIASTDYSATSFTINVNLTDGSPHRVSLYLLDWSTSARSETISIVDFNSNQVLNTESYSSFHNGVYATWTIQGHVFIQVKRTAGDNAVVSGIFFDSLATASAKYSGLDAATEGTWSGRYGADGYLIANGATNTPSYAAVSLSGDTPYTWTTSTTDPRALQTSSGSSTRIASADYSTASFTINVNLTDGNTHRIALYLLDWSTAARSETISILDAVTNTVLDTESYSSFHNGVYAVWTVKGHVVIKVQRTGGDNGVVSGIFFDPIPSSTATYTGLDITTEGTWTGKYGANGYIIANGAANPPAFASLSFVGDTPYTWTTSTTDPRALQTSSGSSTRIASADYSTASFTINLNLTDGNAHSVALYLLDWSTTGRSETITILDAVTNAILTNQSYSGFHNGEYAVWTIRGHVLIQVQRTGGDNAVVSGIFF